MKEKAIRNINRVGKIGRVFSIIIKVCLVIGFIAAMIVTVIAYKFPDNFIVMNASGNGEVVIDATKVNKTITEKDKEKIIKEIDNIEKDITIQGFKVNLDKTTVEDNKIHVSGKVASQTVFDVKDLFYPIITADITLIFAFIAMIFVGRFFKALSYCQSPFEDDVIKNMKRFAWTLVPWSILSSLGQAFVKYRMSGHFDLNININQILIVLLILGLVYIFKYGAVLQQESDETL